MIGERDYFSVAGCENATIAVDPRDPNVTYGGCYTGFLSRYDRNVRQERDISAWMANYDGYAASDIKYRFQWTFPVHLSPHDPSTLYIGSQYVMRSRDEGASWERISPGPDGRRSENARANGRSDCSRRDDRRRVVCDGLRVQ